MGRRGGGGGDQESGGGDESKDNGNEKTKDLDKALHAIGFHIDTISPQLVSGRLRVNQTCCQPFGVLHGGISALISEALASIGAHLASNYKRVAGIQLTINHLKASQLGDTILAQATPLHVGRTIQVWDVGLWKIESWDSQDKRGSKVSSSRVTLVSNLPVPDSAKNADHAIKKYARL